MNSQLVTRGRMTGVAGLTSVCMLAAMAPWSAHAATAADDWKWGATIYLWLPSFGGETSFPPNGGGPPIDVSGEQILDSLNLAFMGAFEGRKGRWGLATDLIYLDLGGSKKGTRNFGLGQVEIPATVDADLELDITGCLWTLEGSYEVIQQENFAMNVLGGVRMLDLEQTLQRVARRRGAHVRRSRRGSGCSAWRAPPARRRDRRRGDRPASRAADETGATGVRPGRAGPVEQADRERARRQRKDGQGAPRARDEQARG